MLAALNFNKIIDKMYSIQTGLLATTTYAEFLKSIEDVKTNLPTIINTLNLFSTTLVKITTSSSLIPVMKDVLNNGFILNYLKITDISNIVKDFKTHNEAEIVMKGGAVAPPAKILGVPKEASLLYDIDEIKKLFNILDTILRTFSIGQTAYLQRDMGCLSIEPGYKRSYIGIKSGEDLKTQSAFKVRKYVTDTKNEKYKIVIKNVFYTLNYPSFIEVFINKKIQNYNSTNPFYYSENQYSSLDNSGIIPEKLLPIFEKYNDPTLGLSEEQKQAIMNQIIRLLLIPTNDAKLIAGQDILNPEKQDRVDYSNLALKFNNTFNKNSETLLKKRLIQLLKVEPQTVTKQSNSKIKHNPKHIIDLLLEVEDVIDIKKHYFTKNEVSDPVPTLINLNYDGKKSGLIFKLYEYIMIMLKLKYYKFIDKNVRLPIKGGGNYIDRRFIGNTMLKFNPIKKISQKNLLNNTMNNEITYTPKLKTKKRTYSTKQEIKGIKTDNSKHSKQSKHSIRNKKHTKGHMKKQSRNKKVKQHKLSKKKT